MEIKQLTIYECSYCRKYYKMKHYCLRHEMQCSLSPNNHHTCYDCKFLSVDRVDSGDGFGVIKHFNCDKKNILMHTCKAEARGFAKRLGTVRMPLECDMYESEVQVYDFEF